MRLFAFLAFAAGALFFLGAQAQFQPVIPLCGQPAAPCSATNPLPVTPATGAVSDVNVTKFGGSLVVTGTGTGGSGIPRVTVSSDSFPTTGNAGNNPVYVQDGNTSGSISGSNPMQIAPVDATQVAFTCSATCSVTNSGVLAGPIDTSVGVNQVVIHLTSAGSGNTTAFQASEDGTNWLAARCQRDDGVLVTAIAGANRYACSVGRYFRILNTTYGSGTLAGAVTLKATPQPIGYQQISTLSSQYPFSATAITASATGTTGATTATLAGVAGKTTFMCGFSISADATAFTVGTATVTSTITGTMSFRQGVGALATQTAELGKTFSPCVPASAAATGIAINSIAAGTGGNTAVSAWGYQL